MSTKKKNRGKKPIRKCICCEADKPKSDMIRIVLPGRNTVETENNVDDTGKQHGRGAYICRNSKCIEQAFKDGIIDEATRSICYENMNSQKLQMISIAMKAGYLASGEFQCEETIQKGKAYYVIISEDASDNTKKKFTNKCEYQGIKYEIYGKKEEIGHLIGKNERSVIAITDEDFSTQFMKKFGGNE